MTEHSGTGANSSKQGHSFDILASGEGDPGQFLAGDNFVIRDPTHALLPGYESAFRTTWCGYFLF